MPGPLEGIRVLEFTEIIAAPFGGMLLADMGADIIKVEPPWGEPWRFSQEFIPGESRTFISLNRGKRSLPLDLTKPEALEIIYKLVPDTDVVIINYRPDVPIKLGIDYKTLSAQNPRIIYCDNTAFGRQGPDSQRPGYDIIIQAMSGIMTAGDRIKDGVPQQVGAVAIADFATGLAIAWGVCAALYVRERTGRGQLVEATLLASALGVQVQRFTNIKMVDDEAKTQFLEDLVSFRAGGVSYDDIQEHYQERRAWQRGNIYYRSYKTKDDVIVVGCLSDRLRKRLAAALDLRDIRFEPGYDRNSSEAETFGAELVKKAEALFREKTTEEWLAILDEAGVPAGPVKFIEELMEDEQVLANDLVVDLEHATAGPLKTVGPMLKMDQTPLKVRSASPALGQHTDEILTALGYSPKEIQGLKDREVTR